MTTHPLDSKATTLAKDYLRTEAELLSVLMEMKRRKLFFQLDYSGVFDYCERRLKLSRMQSFYFKSVAEKAEEVPALKSAIASGEISLSQARRIVPVVSPENCIEWVAKAQTLPQRELERQVTAINPKAHFPDRLKPVARDLAELRVTVDAETESNLRALTDILSQKMGKPASLGDVVAWAAETARERFDPIRKAARNQVRKAKSISSGNELGAAHPARRPIPAKAKHEVMLRDQGRCAHVSATGERCPQKRWLDYHHLTEVHRGGSHSPANLRLLCRAHHAIQHRAYAPAVGFGARSR